MTTNEILERLERWQEAVSRVEEVMDGLHKLLGAHPESPMFEAIYPLQGLATEQARIAALEVAIEAQRRKLSSITDQIAALYLIADAVAAALDDARDALDEGLK